MYKLLIVDDEYWVRKRLVSHIDWSSLGISEVYEAEDGRQALGISIEKEPDIIITDISMPELSGIELMQALNESALYPHIVLISGYNEFEYARSAIKLGAVDYLLKPVDENELIAIIKKCIGGLQKDEHEKEVLDALMSYSSEIQKRFITDLLLGRIEDPDSSLLRLKHLNLDFSYEAAICLAAHVSEMKQIQKNDYVDETLTSFSISNVMNDVLSLFFEHLFVLQIDDMNIAVLFSGVKGDELQKVISEAINKITNELSENYNTNIAFGVGCEVSSMLDLNKSYKTANYTISFNNYNNWKSIATYADNNKKDYLDFQNVYQDYNIEAICKKIKNCDSAAASAGLRALVNEFLADSPEKLTPLQVELFYINVLNTLFKNCLVYGPPTEEFLNICIDSLMDAKTFFKREKLVSNLQKIVDFLISQYSTFDKNKRHWLIDGIIDYIKENYPSPITMKSVANKFYLNPSYFCTLFKDETGLTFTHYLMKIRIDKAKELMVNSTEKLYDIAASVGYSNSQYFSTIFKEMEGVSPSEYRSIHSNNQT